MNKSRECPDCNESQQKWYQTSIREMLLLTTLVAALLSLWKTIGIPAIWTITCVSVPLLPLVYRIVVSFLRFRAAWKECDIWDPSDYSPDTNRHHECGSTTSGPCRLATK